MKREWLVEDCAELDIAVWYKYAPELTDSGEVRGGILPIRLGDETIEVQMAFHEPARIMGIFVTVVNGKGDKQESTEILDLDWTPCNLGGKRVWALCPECERRIRKLYKPPSEMRFLCLQCYPLIHSRSRISGNSEEVLKYKIRRLASKLGAKRQDSPMASIPVRPRYMHTKTYFKLARQLLILKLDYHELSTKLNCRLVEKEQQALLIETGEGIRGLLITRFLQNTGAANLLLFNAAIRYYYNPKSESD